MKAHIAAGPSAADPEDSTGLPRLVVDDQEALCVPEDGQIMQTVCVHQKSEGIPKLELRSSFRNSFAKSSTFSLSKFCAPE